jgi:hypothetical protein
MKQAEQCFGCPFDTKIMLLEIPQTVKDFDKYVVHIETSGPAPDQILFYREFARSLRPADQEEDQPS